MGIHFDFFSIQISIFNDEGMKDYKPKSGQELPNIYDTFFEQNNNQEEFRIENQTLVHRKVFLQKKICPACGIEFSKGRTDKKYCSSQCKSKIHNACNREKLSQVHEINRMLRNNREILKTLKKKGFTTKEELINLGFIEHLITSIENVDKKVVKLCYEYGYYSDKKGKLRIVYIPRSN